MDVIYQVDNQTLDLFREPLASWFHENKRELPWRIENRDPYSVWVSEIMLQQTRIEQMLPFYERFVKLFPDVGTLAASEIDDVLKAWEGLGYYSRCRNMHKTATIICRDHDGRFPTTAAELESLPGIGRYTAAAIASSVFSEPAPAVDGNIKRVLARVFAIEASVDSTLGIRLLYDLAGRLIDVRQPGDFNESLMELGATICTPKSPNCDLCPLATNCISKRLGTQTEYPRRTKKKKIPHYNVAVAIVIDGKDRIYVQKRPDTGLLAGMWEFPGGKNEPGETMHRTCLRELSEETGIEAIIVKELAEVRHAYSHFKVSITPFVCSLDEARQTQRISNTRPDRWISWDEIDTLVFPRANRKILEQLQLFLNH